MHLDLLCPTTGSGAGMLWVRVGAGGLGVGWVCSGVRRGQGLGSKCPHIRSRAKSTTDDNCCHASHVHLNPNLYGKVYSIYEYVRCTFSNFVGCLYLFPCKKVLIVALPTPHSTKECSSFHTTTDDNLPLLIIMVKTLVGIIKPNTYGSHTKVLVGLSLLFGL